MKLNNKYIILFLNIFILLIIPNCNRLNTISIEADKGILNLEEIDLAYQAAKKNGAKEIILLYCVSNYPSKI